MTDTIRSKLPHVGTTIFTVLSNLASEHEAINLGQGFPDFHGHQPLMELVAKHMREGRNQYAPMPGVPALRERIADKNRRCYARASDPDTEITVTSGATEALFCAITATVHPGDEVIVFDPAYDSYCPAIELAGGKPVRLSLKAPSYRPDWNEVADALNERTRLVIVNTPHNPSGTIWRAEDMAELAELLRDRPTLVLADEVYEHMTFDGRRHESMLRHEELAARSFVVSSFGKTFHTTGWKVGYCVAPEALTREFRKIHQYVTFCTSTPMQYALADFMAEPQHYMELADFYQAKRDHFLERIRGSRFRVMPCEGTYFQLLDYSAITGVGDAELAQSLIREHGIAAVPMSVFYADGTDNKVLRFCFAKRTDTLDKAAEILCAI